MQNYLAIDAGGTSTRSVLLDSSGQCLGYGTAGGGNPVSRGLEGALDALYAASELAAQGNKTPIESAVFCMAGGSLDLPTQLFAERFTQLGLRGKVMIESDLLATFYSGSFQDDGYALIAGTGAVAARVHNSDLAAVADGTGWILGDSGSGFWLGREAIRAVAAELDGRGPHTALTSLALAELEIPYAGPNGSSESKLPGRNQTLQELVAKTYQLAPIEISRFAPLLFKTQNDQVSSAIIEAAASELAKTLGTVMDGSAAETLVFGGSVLTKGNTVANAVLEQLPSGVRSANAPAPTLVHDGTVGAAVLALKRNGIDVGEEIFERIRSSLSELRD